MSKFVVGARAPDDTAPYDLQPGQYCKRNGNWWVCCPGEQNGGGQITGNIPSFDEPNPANWEVVEHEEGTISVTPSIHLVVNGVTLYHGYLTNGVWNAC